ncbi:MAG TPA: phosphodiester glycosidase family protein, partial [Bryobacteraceae bacterium]|nr:phosphodiester glycosidase family protein [Bryobacteraceae bacterium]
NDRAIGRETMSSLAKRYGAKAAVNSGYFVTTGPYSGASAGAYLWNGEVVSNGRNRTVLLLCAEQNGVEKIDTDIVNFEGKITTSKGLSHAVTGVNRPRGANDLIVYRPMLGPTTLTDRDGVEAIVDARGRVVKVEDGAGNTEIPRDGYVISASGAAADWLRSKVSQGSAIQLDLQLKPSRPDTCKATDIVGGGPLLVRNGKAMPSQENLAHEAKRHPRTAAGYTRRGTILFVTVDGRQSSSAGMRIDELAQELVSLGAVEAVNLDGGGSTTMLVNGRIRNSPSDGVERPVSDGLLVLTGGEHRRGFSQSSKH